MGPESKPTMRVEVLRERELKLTETEVQIFRHIVENGPKNEYQLKVDLGMSGGTIHYVLERLNKKGLLKPAVCGTARTGKQIKTYRLTHIGLYAALLHCRVEKIVEKWSELEPTIFGSWKEIVKIIPEDEAINALKRAATYLFTTLYYDENGDLITDGPILQYALRSEFFEHIVNRQIPILEKWMEAIKSCENLRESAISYLKQWLNRNQYRLYLVEEAMEVLKGAKQKINLEEVDAKIKHKLEEWSKTE